jgi:hypothetical protein
MKRVLVGLEKNSRSAADDGKFLKNVNRAYLIKTSPMMRRVGIQKYPD